MLCALTVRTLKPGTFEQFRDAFMAHENLEDPPTGYVHFSMIRNTESRDEVICFGLFDGTAQQLGRAAAEQGYTEQLKAIAPFVESVGADGLYEMVENHAFTGPTAGCEGGDSRLSRSDGGPEKSG
jgi:hypothetical protein